MSSKKIEKPVKKGGKPKMSGKTYILEEKLEIVKNIETWKDKSSAT